MVWEYEESLGDEFILFISDVYANMGLGSSYKVLIHGTNISFTSFQSLWVVLKVGSPRIGVRYDCSNWVAR